uniref:DUF5655 domain-containing protein n=1 Tax=Pedobacter schmidteae TaxID=2201271 RepID=UPI0018D57C83|nr:DUF5655 domain-containing protein [Pedobacter schmidteae]
MKTNQTHACNEKTVADFLAGKSAHTLMLFDHFMNYFKDKAEVHLNTTKTMISVEHQGGRIMYISQLGKNFIHVVFPFKQLYPDNLCFIKTGQVPGSNQFNHHFRMYFMEDLNDEVKTFINLALEEG